MWVASSIHENLDTWTMIEIWSADFWICLNGRVLDLLLVLVYIFRFFPSLYARVVIKVWSKQIQRVLYRCWLVKETHASLTIGTFCLAILSLHRKACIILHFLTVELKLCHLFRDVQIYTVNPPYLTIYLSHRVTIFSHSTCFNTHFFAQLYTLMGYSFAQIAPEQGLAFIILFPLSLCIH
jgi:hypothetical protein